MDFGYLGSHQSMEWVNVGFIPFINNAIAIKYLRVIVKIVWAIVDVIVPAHERHVVSSQRLTIWLFNFFICIKHQYAVFFL